MPFSIRHTAKGYQVITTATGKVHGTFPGKAGARRQLRALYANGADKDRK